MTSPTPTILLADDDKSICTVLEHAMRAQGYEILIAHNGQKLMEWVEAGKGDLVITDVLMPGGNGLDLLPQIKALRPALPVIVISAQNTLMTAVKAQQLGASEYLPKPFDLNALMECVENALQPQQQMQASESDKSDDSESQQLIGRSPAMQDIYKTLAKLLNNDLTVLIRGESGTGKELVARALHQLGHRKTQPFVPVNMAAIPRELVESELFGHEKGSFTGAVTRKAGKFEQAEGGTLFLDEIGDMPMDAQTKLLRVLQQGEYTAVGGNRPIKANVRIVCATHRDLQQLTQTGEFREDLFFRLNVVPLKVPSLRDRREDVPELVAYFLARAQKRGLPMKQLHTDAIGLMQDYSWPGNVRELENLIYKLAVIYSQPVISADTIRAELPMAFTKSINIDAQVDGKSLGEIVHQHLKHYFKSHSHGLPAAGLYDRVIGIVEKELIELTLEATRGNQIKAASVLGINRNTLRKKIGEIKSGATLEINKPAA